MDISGQCCPAPSPLGVGVHKLLLRLIVPIDILSPGGLALCASWLREPDCAWVHIRCPAAIFPKRTLNSQLPSQEVERCIHTFYQLLKHCKDTDTRWTVEAPSRSSFWTTSLSRDLEACAVDIDLSRFSRSRPHSFCIFLSRGVGWCWPTFASSNTCKARLRGSFGPPVSCCGLYNAYPAQHPWLRLADCNLARLCSHLSRSSNVLRAAVNCSGGSCDAINGEGLYGATKDTSAAGDMQRTAPPPLGFPPSLPFPSGLVVLVLLP